MRGAPLATGNYAGDTMNSTPPFGPPLLTFWEWKADVKPLVHPLGCVWRGPRIGLIGGTFISLGLKLRLSKSMEWNGPPRVFFCQFCRDGGRLHAACGMRHAARCVLVRGRNGSGHGHGHGAQGTKGTGRRAPDKKI